MNGGCGYDEIRLRERVARLPAVVDQKPPLEHDVFRDRENPLVKHGPHLAREPVVQRGTAIGFAHELDPKPELCKRDHADIKLLKRTRDGNFSRIPKHCPETFLLKMPVVGENLVQPFLAHRLHRNAIDQAVAFVGAV